ncbi:MAG TPA: hypothetical protein V6D15_00255 [Oculatellaceae cyanobacterium]
MGSSSTIIAVAIWYLLHYVKSDRSTYVKKSNLTRFVIAIALVALLLGGSHPKSFSPLSAISLRVRLKIWGG